jgi:P-type Ca2+ transporter type 2C
MHHDDAEYKILPDDVVDEIVGRCNVFSRAQPEDKMAIIKALQRMEFVVSMTGDGVNDVRIR